MSAQTIPTARAATASPPTLTKQKANALRGRPEAAVRLPEPDTAFRAFMAPPELARSLLKFDRAGVLEVERYYPSASNEFNVYAVPRHVYRWVAAYIADRPVLPCGHGGFRRLGGTGYTCGYDPCEAVHPRVVVEARFGQASGADGQTEFAIRGEPA